MTHPSMMHASLARTSITRALPCALLLVSLAACDRPRSPDPELPPAPQARDAASLNDAIHAPLDKAKAVEAQTLEAADRQRAAIDAATGG